jgi:hypothetical protein
MSKLPALAGLVSTTHSILTTEVLLAKKKIAPEHAEELDNS